MKIIMPIALFKVNKRNCNSNNCNNYLILTTMKNITTARKKRTTINVQSMTIIPIFLRLITSII